MSTDRFEVGNTVLAEGRVSRVEKVYKNGNFKIAGIDGQWRQGGWKAGDVGWHSPVCVHYTEEVAKREARRRLEVRLSNLMYDAGKRCNQDRKALSDDDIQAGIDALTKLIGKLTAT